MKVFIVLTNLELLSESIYVYLKYQLQDVSIFHSTYDEIDIIPTWAHRESDLYILGLYRLYGANMFRAEGIHTAKLLWEESKKKSLIVSEICNPSLNRFPFYWDPSSRISLLDKINILLQDNVMINSLDFDYIRNYFLENYITKHH